MIPTMLYLFTRRLHSHFGTELQQLDFATIARPLECSLIMRAFKILGWWRGAARFEAHGERVGLVPNLVWRVKLVAELRPGVLTETEVPASSVTNKLAWLIWGFGSPKRNG